MAKDLKAAQIFHKTLPLVELGEETSATLDDVVAAINALKAAFNAHCADVTAHAAADTTNPVVFEDVVNQMDFGNAQ